MKWSYGVTTVQERLYQLLPHTLCSLHNAGFDDPILFIDGNADGGVDGFRTCRHSNKKLGVVGNWILALWELYIREPHVDRYAIFQDDLVICRNARDYLEKTTTREKVYWNLYTFPYNEKSIKGWYQAPMKGKGAVGLVFTNEGVTTLLAAKELINKPKAARRPTQNLDGMIYQAMNDNGWAEYVHNPSLVQHTGMQSSIGHRKFPLASTFPGEKYDVMESHAGAST